jgi:sterol desaturase/sphingolipid hydroxylase (fatty acid hydroxylase superfamily)
VTGGPFVTRTSSEECGVRGIAQMRLVDAALKPIARMSVTPLNYWAEFAVDIPLGAAMILGGLRRGGLDLNTVLTTILLGLLLFSFIEYAFHRWLLHGKVRFLVDGHRAHHDNPQGYDSLPFFLPGLILVALAGVLACLIPASRALLLIGTVALGYAAYGLSHFILHRHRFRRGIGRSWAGSHHVHHFRTDTNFGVTTPLWDVLLGTRHVAKHRR